MKKLLLIGLIFLTGCTNPISSKISNEGDSTRQTITSEMATAKLEISEELRKELESIIINVDARIMNLFDYMTIRQWGQK